MMTDDGRAPSAERQALVDQIVRHEGIRLRAYPDSVGKITIGIGRNLSDKGISSGEAFYLLDHDLDEAITDCASWPWFVTLDTIRQRVMIDLRFNLGGTGLRTFVKFLAAMEAGHYQTAADELLASKWALQVQPDRVRRLMLMLATGMVPL